MTLATNANMAQIIAAFQAITGINSLTELAALTGSSATDVGSQTVALAALRDSLVALNNAQDSSNSTIKADIVSKLTASDTTLVLLPTSTWAAIQAALATLPNKATLAAALNTVSVDNPLGLSGSSTWAQVLAAVPNVKTGKRVATGTVTSSSSSSSFTMADGSTSTTARITVATLDFQPSIVIATCLLNTANGSYVLYSATSVFGASGSPSSAKILCGGMAPNASGASDAIGVREDATFGVKSNGFILPVGSLSATYSYLAIA